MSNLRNHAPFGNGPTRLKDVKTSACTSCYGTGFDVMGKPCSCKHLYIESDNMGTQVINEQFYTYRITTLQSENERLRAQVEEFLAVNQVMRDASKKSRETILSLVNSRSSEVEGSEADWVGDIDDALALKPGDVELVEVGSMQNDMRTGHSYNILFNDGMHQPIGTKLYVLKQKEGK